LIDQFPDGKKMINGGDRVEIHTVKLPDPTDPRPIEVWPMADFHVGIRGFACPS
jgi:hypothetical protein